MSFLAVALFFVLVSTANLLFYQRLCYRYVCALRREVVLINTLAGKANGNGPGAFLQELAAQEAHPFSYTRFWQLPPVVGEAWPS